MVILPARPSGGFAEEDLLPISALQHLLFCPRQCALIHVERLWAENSLTREGRHLHEKADSGQGESPAAAAGGPRAAAPVAGARAVRQGRRRGVPSAAGDAEAGEARRSCRSRWSTSGASPSGTARTGCSSARQALCLEEMLGRAVPAGALFYGKTRRRQDVAFDAAASAVDAGHDPPAARDGRLGRHPAGRAGEEVRAVLAAAPVPAGRPPRHRRRVAVPRPGPGRGGGGAGVGLRSGAVRIRPAAEPARRPPAAASLPSSPRRRPASASDPGTA